MLDSAHPVVLIRKPKLSYVILHSCATVIFRVELVNKIAPRYECNVHAIFVQYKKHSFLGTTEYITIG